MAVFEWDCPVHQWAMWTNRHYHRHQVCGDGKGRREISFLGVKEVEPSLFNASDGEECNQLCNKGNEYADGVDD